MADYTAAIIAVTGTLLGAAVTGGIQGILSSRANQQRLERDKAARAFEMSTTKRTRLLRRYETVALSLDHLVSTVANAHWMVLNGYGEKVFDEEVFSQYQSEAHSALQKFGDSVALLALESDHQDFNELCRVVVDEIKNYMQDARREAETGLDYSGVDQPHMLYERVDQLRNLMREHLHELEKPI